MPKEFGIGQERSALLAGHMAAHGKLFYKLAYDLLRNATAAEDACQQAMLNALQKANAIREADSIKAWLARIVVTESLRIRRQLKTDQRVLARHASNQRDVAPGGDNWELREAVLEAVEKLPESIRLIVIMRMLNGMSGGEVKGILECTDAHISRELHRGMEILRDVLSEWNTTDNATALLR